MTSGLRWPWCGILSRRGSTGRMTCKSSFVSSWGYYTNYTQCALKFQWRDRSHTNTHCQTCNVHTSRYRGTNPWKVKISHVCFPHDSLVNYWTELVLLIRALVRTQRISYLSNTSLHTHIHGHRLTLMHPGNTYMQKQQMQSGGAFFFFSFFFSTCSCSLSRWDSSWCASVLSCCFEHWGLNMSVSFTDKTEDFSGTFSLLECIIHLFCSTLSICYPNRWHWWWGWMIKLCYYLCHGFILLWLADGGRRE